MYRERPCRRFHYLLLSLILIAPSITPAVAASPAGRACSKVGARTISGGLLFRCGKVGTSGKAKLRWNSGVRCTSGQSTRIGTATYRCLLSGTKWIWSDKDEDLPLPEEPKIVYPTLTTPTDLAISTGGDTDVVPFTDQGVSGWRTGNDQSLGSNSVPDRYLSLTVNTNNLQNITRPYHSAVTVTFLDKGTDTFVLEYDSAGGPWSTTRTIHKTNTGTLRTVSFNLCDGYFGKRQNGSDIRLSDNADGAELITQVELKFLPSGRQQWNVDDYGANPFDDRPDSDAIQAVLDASCSGDTIIFTAGKEGENGFVGYLIDQTLKLVTDSAKDHMTYTSSDSQSRSLMKATPTLLGFVLRLYAKGSLDPNVAGKIDDITIQRINFDGSRDARKCTGPDPLADGKGDNWGSSDAADLMEPGNPGTNPGGIMMDGGSDPTDSQQDYVRNPDKWSTNIVIQDLTIENVECGTALGFINSARSTIQRVTVRNAGEHHHVNPACAIVDNDGDSWSWADGMTVGGPDLVVRDNQIFNPSDVGIVTFGGKGQKITNNRIETTEGNYGTFAGIHVQVGAYGDSSDLLIEGNLLVNRSNSECGGMHFGIAMSTMVFLAGCLYSPWGTQFGSQWGPEYAVASGCNYDDLVTKPVIGRCAANSWCTAFIHADPGRPIIMRNNSVTGAHVNYTVGNVDGPLIETGNVSISPRMTDFETAQNCRGTKIEPTDKIALLPSLSGWTEFGLTCWT